MKALNRVAYFIVSLLALASAGAVLAGLVWLVIDLMPAMSQTRLTTEDKGNILFTIGLAVGVFTFCKLVEKPFDTIMDKVYPDDIKPEHQK